MFCPPDYTPLSDLFRQWQDQRQKADLRRVEDRLIKEVGERKSESYVFRELAPSDLSELEFFSSLSGQLFLASPEGKVMAVSHWPFVDLHTIGFTISQLDNHAETQRQVFATEVVGADHFQRYRLFDRDIEDIVGASLQDERINDSKASIWKIASELGYGRMHCLFPLLYERVGYSIDLHLVNYVDYIMGLPKDFRGYAELLRNFDGWALCASKKFLDTSTWKRSIEVVVEADFEYPSKPMNDARKQGGRPRLEGGEVAEIIEREFTDRVLTGDLSAVKKEAVIQEAQDFILKVTGRAVSRSTIQDYLAPIYLARSHGTN